MDDVLPVGAALRQHRLAAGLSLGDLAARVHYSKGYLSKIENGAKHPGPDLLRRCDTALAANGALDALAPAESTGSTEPEPALELGWLLAMAPEDGPILGRRGMLAVGGSIPLLAATASGSARPPAAGSACRSSCAAPCWPNCANSARASRRPCCCRSSRSRSAPCSRWPGPGARRTRPHC